MYDFTHKNWINKVYSLPSSAPAHNSVSLRKIPYSFLQFLPETIGISIFRKMSCDAPHI